MRRGARRRAARAGSVPAARRLIWREAAARGSRRAGMRRRGWRQSGKPGAEGRARERRARRSGGKAKESSASAWASSAGESPGRRGTPAARRWERTASARGEKDARPERGEGAGAARAERRRSPAA
ncbi:hypothetical protein C4D60_Mb01t10570 [Musa balbisiana]|uniref:Uncharacterized protein n=1 Tax=Musa balbisiana TaxID=52838 RepID=A0A4S8JL96_MUSBA|nr:hypothetical protein C4D60_Mb01t10570 [Musa balbisiana]